MAVNTIKGKQEKRDDFLARAHLDLLMHQNTLMHGRFNIFYLMQGAFFVSANFVRHSIVGLAVVCVVSLILARVLYSLLVADRNLRDEHADALAARGLLALHSKRRAPRVIFWANKQSDEWWFHVMLFAVFAALDISFAVAVHCGWFSSK